MARHREKGLNEPDYLFALEYLANGQNAKRAYLKAHPKAKDRTAEVEGSKLLRKPELKAFIDQEMKARRQRLRMDGDEALEAITRIARVDPRRIFKDNRLLRPEDWPDDVADAVKAIKPTPFGTAIVFYDKLKARELMAVAGGKLRQQVDHKHTFDHAAYLGAEPPQGDDDAEGS